MSIRVKMWLVVALGVVAGVLDSYLDHVKVFGYLRNAFVAAIPAMIAARFLYDQKK